MVIDLDVYFHGQIWFLRTGYDRLSCPFTNGVSLWDSSIQSGDQNNNTGAMWFTGSS